MTEINETDISGMIFTVSGGSGNTSGSDFDKIVLSEDEWYPATLVNITKVNRPGTPDGKIKASGGLNWAFDLIGDEYSVTINDKVYQKRLYGRTSLIFSSNPERPSKLFQWYCKLSGKVPADGAKVTLSSLIGLDVFVLLKVTTGKDGRIWYNVEKVKLAQQNHTPKQEEQVVVKQVQPTVQKQENVVKKSTLKPTLPEDLPSDFADEDQVNEQVKNTADDDGLYSDVF